MVTQGFRFFFAGDDAQQAAKILERGYREFPRITAKVHGVHRENDWIEQRGILVSDQPDPRTSCVIELECCMTPRRLKRLELESLRHGVRFFLLYDVRMNEQSLRLLSADEIATAAKRWETEFTGFDPLVWFEKRRVGDVS